MTEEPNDQHTVYYDGSCPMCSSLITRIEGSERGTQFKCVDITTEKLPDTLSQQAVEKEIHVADETGRIFRNSDAIMKIMEAYPRMKWIARIGLMPGVRQILPIGYSVVAAYRHLIFGPNARIFWLKITLGLAMVAGLLLSPNLWLSNRMYPLTPVWNGLPIVPQPLDVGLYLLMLLLLLIVIIHKNPRPFIVAFIVVGASLALLDQSRLQPWFYQYICMMIVVSFHGWRNPEGKRLDSIMQTCRFIIASIYFWSGMQKLNLTFLNDSFPWFIEPIANLLPEDSRLFASAFAIIVPLLEMRIGIGLLTRSFRKSSIVYAILAHCFILVCVGPFGRNWNSVIWPWNIAMIFFVLILFARVNEVPFKSFFPPKKFILYPMAFVLFGIMPLFSFFNLWDSYLSSSLYSENTSVASITLSEEVRNQLPSGIQAYVTEESGNRFIVDIGRWSYGELNVPAYPESRIYRNIASTFCRFAKKPSDVRLMFAERPKPLSEARKVVRLDCSKLHQ